VLILIGLYMLFGRSQFARHGDDGEVVTGKSKRKTVSIGEE
jgi:hypothetical protein